jgi:hypothetical protein
MNTKIVVQRLVNVVHSRAKASLALIEINSGTLHSIKLGLVTVVLFASACVVGNCSPQDSGVRLALSRESFLTRGAGADSSSG